MNLPDSPMSVADSLGDTDPTVELWRIGLRVRADETLRLRSVLACDEQQRAGQFATEHLARRFIVCRAATRLILAGCVGGDAGQLKFHHGPYGKPALAGSGAEALLRFNVSHSADLAVLAVAWQREVGVDVEAVRPIMHLDRLVQRCLGLAEQRVFHENKGADGSQLFLNYWTHKEAYLKAIGVGLQIPLNAVQFGLHEQGRLQITRQPEGEQGGGAAFRVVGLRLGDGYRGALVAQGADPLAIRYRDWQGAS